MQVAGVPNDVLTNLNPMALIILIPLLDTLVYPGLRKLRLNPTPLKRIAIGYFVAASAMIWACVIQYYIYKTNECGYYANGVLADGTEVECPNSPINMWAQSGSYILIAFSEIMASITSLEYAHSKAPANMRSMVQSVALFMNAISSAIGFALVTLAKDPLLVWNYATVAILAVFGGTMFWLQMRGLDKQEDELNMLPKGEVGDVVSSAQFDEGEKNASKA
jgi:POT family proton-dependent oligopeptide transporter